MSTSLDHREFDLVLFGATGYTGRLVAEHLATSADKPRWAVAGRSRARLEELGLGVQVLVAEAHDRPALDALARRTKVVCTTAGPYAKYGSELVAACAEAGTHYCDLAGEVPWMRRMIDRHHERARATGARIVHACGFDSVPSDLGTWALQQEFVARFGRPAERVTAMFSELSGGFSGGTIASLLGVAAEAAVDPEVREILDNPYALDPDPHASRPRTPDEKSIGWDRRLRMLTVPFMMARINTRVVRRAHALAGLPWGESFVYREVLSRPISKGGVVMAATLAGGMLALGLAFKHARLRELVARYAPKPGEGPSPEQREHGRWKLRLVGETGANGATEVLGYTASDRTDPGHRSTSKMIGEAALCLAFDPQTSSGGVLTPSVAMGGALLGRLRRAGLTFAVAG